MNEEKTATGKYYKFKNHHIFDDYGNRCSLYNNNKNIQSYKDERGEGVKTKLSVDLYSGEINEIRMFFRDTYLSKAEIIKKVGTVNDLVEVNKEEAIDILKNNEQTISTLLRDSNLTPTSTKGGRE